MIRDALLLALLVLLGRCGAQVARRAGAAQDPALLRAMGLPLGLSLVILSAGLAARLIPLWACLGLATLAALGAARWAGQEPLEPTTHGPPLPPPFTRTDRWILGLTLACTLFYVHTTQLIRPEDDFWIHYPVTRSLLQGNVPPVNPFFPDLALQGHYGRHLLLATMSVTQGGDTLRTQWILEGILAVNSLALWALTLRELTGSPRAGALGTLLLFLGINVGSRVGLMDAYDNNNLLVYLLLPALLALVGRILDQAHRRLPIPGPLPWLCGGLLGVYGAVYETHFCLVLGTLVLSALAVAWLRRGERRRLLRATLTIVGLACPLALAQGGTLQHLLWQTLTPGPAAIRSTGEQNQSQTVTIRFPKRPPFTIRLGADIYQRLSFAMDTALFRRYQPVLDEGGQAFIFGPKVLVLHWLPTWLAPLTLAWALWRRSLAGLLLGAFGIQAYLVPALVDFGPVHEMEYFRWEFAAGAAFAALLGCALADLWARRPQGPLRGVAGAALTLLLLFDLVGAQRRINDLVIDLQRDPSTARRVLQPWYPETGAWLMDLPGPGLTPSDLAAARWLAGQIQPGERLLTGFRSEGHDSMLWESAMAGLSGAFPVGHALPPAWLPVGVAPYLPTQATVAFRQTGDPSLLAGMGVDWLLVNPRRGETSPRGLEPIAVIGGAGDPRHLYRVPTEGAPPRPLDPVGLEPDLQTRVEGLPGPGSIQSGVAYPVAVHLSRPLRGWLSMILTPEGAPAGSPPLQRQAPITVRIEGTRADTWLVPPLEEGRYRLAWAFAAPGASGWTRLRGETPLHYAFSERVYEALRVERSDLSNAPGGPEGTVTLTNVSPQPFNTGAPLRLQWWVWDPLKHGYRAPFRPEGERTVDLALPPGGQRSIPFQLREPVPAGGRIDFSVAPMIGPPAPISDVHRTSDRP